MPETRKSINIMINLKVSTTILELKMTKLWTMELPGWGEAGQGGFSCTNTIKYFSGCNYIFHDKYFTVEQVA